MQQFEIEKTVKDLWVKSSYLQECLRDYDREHDTDPESLLELVKKVSTSICRDTERLLALLT